MRRTYLILPLAALLSIGWSAVVGFSPSGETGECGTECEWMVWLIAVPALIFPLLVGVLVGLEGQRRGVRLAASIATAGAAGAALAVGIFVTSRPDDPDRLFNTFAILIMGLVAIPISYRLFVMANKLRLRWDGR
jgi:hypothetical protein